MSTVAGKQLFGLFSNNPIATTIKNVVKETDRVVKNVVNESAKVAKGVKDEAVKIGKNISKSTKEIFGNVLKETNRVVKNVVNESVKVAKGVKDETVKIGDNIVKSTVATAGRAVKKGISTVKNIVKENVAELSNKIEEFKEREEVKKLLEQQEKRQKYKTFSEMISGMKLNKGTISNRAELSIEKIYEENYKIGKVFSVGNGEKQEKFKLLDIKETKSGLKAWVLGNTETKEVEIVYEGSNPGFNEPFKDFGNWLKDWGSNFENLTLGKELETLKDATFTTIKGPIDPIMLSKSMIDTYTAEHGTPKSYKDALKVAREVEAEYKNGKNGYKNLVRVSGHSKGGAEAIYTGSHLNLEVIAVDPAPVNNPGKYLYNDKILKLTPNQGKGALTYTEKNSVGAEVSIPSTLMKVASNRKRNSNLPSISVESYIDKKNNKIDNHKTDLESVQKAEDKILKQRELEKRIIEGAR